MAAIWPQHGLSVRGCRASLLRFRRTQRFLRLVGSAHQFQVHNLRAVELEDLADKWLSSVSDRLNGIGEHLRKVEAELATRDVKELSTPQLYSIARKLPPN